MTHAIFVNYVWYGIDEGLWEIHSTGSLEEMKSLLDTLPKSDDRDLEIIYSISPITKDDLSFFRH